MTDTLLSILTDAEVERLRDGYEYATLRTGFQRALYAPYAPGAAWVAAQVDHFYEVEAIDAPPLDLSQDPEAPFARTTALRPQDRERILIGLLAPEGGRALAIHLYWGLALGLPRLEVVDILFLAGTYTGVKAYNRALGVAADTFKALAELARSAGDEGPIPSAAALQALAAAFPD